MHLIGKLASGLALLAMLPNAYALPNPDRPTYTPAQCQSPANLPSDALTSGNQLGSCNWKLWALCIALAAGSCAAPCIAGGFADPACDACVVALGAVGCGSCVHGLHEEEFVDYFRDTVGDAIQKHPSNLSYISDDYQYYESIAVNAQAGGNGNLTTGASKSGYPIGSATTS